MPPFKQYDSLAQERWAHTPSGVAALGQEDVDGKDAASKGLRLPPRKGPKRKPDASSIFKPRFGK